MRLLVRSRQTGPSLAPLSTLLCALFTVAGTYVTPVVSLVGFLRRALGLSLVCRPPPPKLKLRLRARRVDAGVPWSKGWSRRRTRNAKCWRLSGDGQEAGAPHERGVAPDWETRLGGCGVPANATHNNQSLATVACQSLELESWNWELELRS